MKLRKCIVPIISWIAVICWMTFIFSMSAQPAVESDKTSGGVAEIILKIFVSDYDELSRSEQIAMIDDIQHFVRKSAHFCGYALLGALLCNAFFQHIKNRVSASAISQLCGMTYAASDELHQRFVPGRSGEIKDVALDSAGVLFGILFILALVYLVRRIKSKQR